MIPNEQNDSNFSIESTTSKGATIYNMIKNPILVAVVTLMVSVPAINNILFRILQKLPINKPELLLMAIRATLSGVLFFVFSRFL